MRVVNQQHSNQQIYNEQDKTMFLLRKKRTEFKMKLLSTCPAGDPPTENNVVDSMNQKTTGRVL
jgi:hypothetical protein